MSNNNHDAELVPQEPMELMPGTPDALEPDALVDVESLDYLHRRIYEIDDNLAAANAIVPGEGVQAHNSHQAGDPDWLSFDAVGDRVYRIATSDLGGRADTQITIFDSVGFALEDYTILKYINELSERYNMGEQTSLIPDLKNPKNLFGELLLP